MAYIIVVIRILKIIRISQNKPLVFSYVFINSIGPLGLIFLKFSLVGKYYSGA